MKEQVETIRISKLKLKFESLVRNYIKFFEKKQGVIFDYWIADKIGDIAIFGDLIIDFRDIVFDCNNKIAKGLIFEWYDIAIDAKMEDRYFADYENWIKNKKNENKRDY